jgi:hypothetical protein
MGSNLINAPIYDATTSKSGKVELATNGEAQTGTATDKVLTPANMTSAFPSRLSDNLGLDTISTSSQLTITASSKVSYSHGLGAVPKIVQCYLICQATTQNWSAGDIIKLDSYYGSNTGVTIGYTTTTVDLYFASLGIIINKTSFATPNIDFSKWKVVVQAWG